MRSFRKIECFRVEKNAFKKYCLRKIHEKRQFLHILKGLKQGLKVQDKDEYPAFCVHCKISLGLFKGFILHFLLAQEQSFL